MVDDLLPGMGSSRHCRRYQVHYRNFRILTLAEWSESWDILYKNSSSFRRIRVLDSSITSLPTADTTIHITY